MRIALLLILLLLPACSMVEEPMRIRVNLVAEVTSVGNGGIPVSTQQIFYRVTTKIDGESSVAEQDWVITDGNGHSTEYLGTYVLHPGDVVEIRGSYDELSLDSIRAGNVRAGNAYTSITFEDALEYHKKDFEHVPQINVPLRVALV